MWRQCAACGIDLEGVGDMLGAAGALRGPHCARRVGAAIAGNNIEVLLRRMRPSVLDIGCGRYRAALDEGRAVDVDAVEREFRPAAGIEYIPGGHGALSE